MGKLLQRHIDAEQHALVQIAPDSLPQAVNARKIAVRLHIIRNVDDLFQQGHVGPAGRMIVDGGDDSGVFAENINTAGIDLRHLPVGTLLRVGPALLRVTQIGKECHSDCAIRRTAGRCVMPTDGIFAVVVEEGRIKAGDEIALVEESV